MDHQEIDPPSTFHRSKYCPSGTHTSVWAKQRTVYSCAKHFPLLVGKRGRWDKNQGSIRDECRPRKQDTFRFWPGHLPGRIRCFIARSDLKGSSQTHI